MKLILKNGAPVESLTLSKLEQHLKEALSSDQPGDLILEREKFDFIGVTCKSDTGNRILKYQTPNKPRFIANRNDYTTEEAIQIFKEYFEGKDTWLHSNDWVEDLEALKPTVQPIPHSPKALQATEKRLFNLARLWVVPPLLLMLSGAIMAYITDPPRSWKQVTGQIQSIKTTDGGDPIFLVNFTAEGIEYTSTVETASSLQAGEDLKIYYSPEDPMQVQISYDSQNILSYLIILIGALLLGGGIYWTARNRA